MATLAFCDFHEALTAVQSARTEPALTTLVDNINQLFESDCLDVSPRDWGHLASAALIRTFELRSEGCAAAQIQAPKLGEAHPRLPE